MLTAGSTTGAAAAKSAGGALPRKKTAGGTAYHEAGSGEPVVLIHGVGMRLEAWAPQIKSLSGGHRVIAVDMPGHGGSAKLPVGSRTQPSLLLPRLELLANCASITAGRQAGNSSARSTRTWQAA